MKQFDTRFWIYVINAAAGAAIAGVENFEAYIGLTNVEIVQTVLGIAVAALNAARAYLDQHLTRKEEANNEK